MTGMVSFVWIRGVIVMPEPPKELPALYTL